MATQPVSFTGPETNIASSGSKEPGRAQGVGSWFQGVGSWFQRSYPPPPTVNVVRQDGKGQPEGVLGLLPLLQGLDPPVDVFRSEVLQHQADRLANLAVEIEHNFTLTERSNNF